MAKTIIFFFLLLTSIHSSGQDKLTKEHKEIIEDFIGCFKTNDRQKIAENISYPLKREYPLPEIKDKKEFLKRFDEVFDSKLIATIIKSNPSKEDDWSAVGYRGIMLDKGSLWLDYDSKLLAVNYQSDIEAEKLAKLVALEKLGLHPSINKFVKPVSILLTKKYKIRIDDMGTGNYRYSSWKRAAKIRDKPDLIIMNGKFVSEGSGGNHHYTFKNGKYVYECGITLLGEEDSAPAYLTIYKDDKEILSESADIVQH